MKIITWNCNGAFRNKFERISEINADILIIQECENPNESKDKNYKNWATNYIWTGDSKNKGLGIFAKDDIKLKRLNYTNLYDNHPVKHFLPCKVNNDFDLLAVWTHKNNSPNFAYIGQLWKYIQVNKENFKDIVIAGDLNSNKIWDEWDRWWNHSDVVRELSDLKIESLYHKVTGESQGEESKPTLYFQKNISKPYHIDYIFGSKKITEMFKNIKVGDKNSWLGLSDHMPIICDLENL